MMARRSKPMATTVAKGVTSIQPSGPPFDYIRLFRAAPAERIRAIKAGVPASDVKRFVTELHLAQNVVFGALNLKTATVNHKASKNQSLSADESERVLGLAKLVGQLEAMVGEFGDPEGFDAPGWLSRWLRAPLPALGGDRPIGLLDTTEGQAVVSRVLAQMQSGAYA